LVYSEATEGPFIPLFSSAMKAVFPIVCTIVFLVGMTKASEPEKLSDDMIRSQIPGAWISQEMLDGRPMTLTVEYRSNGTLGASAQISEGRYRIKLVLTGTWRVHNGILISHTEATGTPARDTFREVISVNQTILILRDQDGEIVVKRRAAH
jgi:hypothetical protein